MRKKRSLSKREAAIKLVPASVTEPLDFAEIFGRVAPVEIDLGCGDGAFLIALAGENSRRNYLGIERLAGRIRSVCHSAVKCDLGNVRVLRIDAIYAVAHLVPPASVSQFHLLFPDPWPKRRHHRRRAITNEFTIAIHRALIPDGLFHIATDDAEYFKHIERVVSPLFTPASAAIFPKSTFEKRFAGRTIHRLLLRKISPVR